MLISNCVIFADYGRLIDQQRLFTLKDVPDLKIQQEFKVKDLVATGNRLSKEDLELPLENLLESKFNRDVDVHAEEFPDATNVWRISTEHEGRKYYICLLIFLAG